MKKVIISLTLVAAFCVVLATAKTEVAPFNKSIVTVVETNSSELTITKEKEEKEEKKTGNESKGCKDAQKTCCEKSGKTCGSKKTSTSEKSCCGGK